MTDLEIINQLLHGNHVELNDLIRIEQLLYTLTNEVKSRIKHN